MIRIREFITILIFFNFISVVSCFPIVHHIKKKSKASGITLYKENISVYRIGKSANINRYNFILPIIVAVLIKRFGVSPIIIIIATMILGNIFYILKEKREDDKKW